MNSFSASQDQLKEATVRLSSPWDITKEIWQDSAREDFEKEYWIEFEQTTAAAIKNLSTLVETITRAEREIR